MNGSGDSMIAIALLCNWLAGWNLKSIGFEAAP
jgi:hypothetical protein